MLAQGFEALRSFLTSGPPPNKVVESKPDSFIQRGIHSREDGLILYLAPVNVPKGGKSYYEIVLHRPTTESLHQIFSLYRSENLEDGVVKFTVFKDKIPVFVEIAKDMCNLYGLQKICDALTQHPYWTLAHLAANFSLYECFNDPRVNCFLNSTDIATGMSPLQVAISTGNLKIVQLLVSQSCSLEHLDLEGNSIFHYAANTTKDIIGALAQKAPPHCLSGRNKNGHTPLHIACLSDKPECVKALLYAGADVNKTAAKQTRSEIEPGYVGQYLQNNPNKLYIKEMKNGGTPLHWANSRQVIEALIEMNCHIDAVNFEEKTALHVMINRNKLDCVVALLSRGANPDLGDKEGNRPIHLAARTGNVSVIQALIIFGANLDLVNNKGETARHLLTKDQEPKLLYYLTAVGAKRCLSDIQGCTEGCKYDKTYEGVPPEKVNEPTNREMLNLILSVGTMEAAAGKVEGGRKLKGGRLLCLDGGGIRGLILVQMLIELEIVFGKPIQYCFDWIAGTSTGGILALAMASGKSLRECQYLYFRLKEHMFTGIRPYSSEYLEGALKETFGSDTVMTNIKHPKVMVTGVLGDRRPVELHLFRNYRSPEDILEVKRESHTKQPSLPDDQYIWEVGRATGAAPTYFRAFGRYLDGGLIANNPTLDAMTEIHEYNLALKSKGKEHEVTPLSTVVSLGTGLIPVVYVSEIDCFIPENLIDGAKLVFGLTHLGTLLVDQATASDGRVVDRARAWCSSIGVPYFRFNPQLSEDVNMDEKSDEKLCNMLWETKVYMRQNTSTMKVLSDILNRI